MDLIIYKLVLVGVSLKVLNLYLNFFSIHILLSFKFP